MLVYEVCVYVDVYDYVYGCVMCVRIRILRMRIYVVGPNVILSSLLGHKVCMCMRVYKAMYMCMAMHMCVRIRILRMRIYIYI